jgi:hypothetical protein
MSFKDMNVKQSNGGLYVKFKPGITQLRIVSLPTEIYKAFAEDNSCTVFLTEREAQLFAPQGSRIKQIQRMWIIDRTDGLVKLLDSTPAISNRLKELANDEFYGFDGIPPYDIRINKSGTGMTTEYSVMQNPPMALTEIEKKMVKDKIAEVGTIQEMLMKEVTKSSALPTIRVEEQLADVGLVDEGQVDMTSIPF